MDNTISIDDRDFYIQLLGQLPGMIVVMDKQSRFLYSNKYTANMFGFDKESNMLGNDAHSMKCPAVECADEFIHQDQLVMQHDHELTILDIHEYADGKVKILLTKKSPYKNTAQEIIGSICQCTEVQSAGFAKICSVLAKSDKKLRSTNNDKERSYLVGIFPQEKCLSSRELDCMFYILRGKSAKEIGKILEISHRTVDSYIENIKNKLGQYNRSALVDYGLSEGYLNYIPTTILNKNITAVLHAS